MQSLIFIWIVMDCIVISSYCKTKVKHKLVKSVKESLFRFAFLAYKNLNIPILPALENGSDVLTVKFRHGAVSHITIR